MAITPLPTPPSRDDPANFATRGDAFLGALPDFATEANALAVQVNDDAVSAASDAADALAASNAAVASANATKWVSGTTYTEGAVVWSPTTFLTYRRKTTGGGTTDPSADGTNWAQAAGTGNITVTTSGTAGQVLTSQGGGNPLWTTLSPAGTISATASGSITAGATTIVNSDGTVSAVYGSAIVNGTPLQTLAQTKYYLRIATDSTTGKSVLFSGYGTNQLCWVLTVNPTTGALTAGTAVDYTGGTNTSAYQVIAIGNSKILVVLKAVTSNQLYCVIGTISGTSITFGSQVTITGATPNYFNVIYNPSTDTSLLAYDGSVRVISVSGTTPSFGTAVVFDTGTGANMLGYDSTYQKVVLFYKGGTAVTNAGFTYGNTTCFITMSGTTATVGTKTTRDEGGNFMAGCQSMAYNSSTQQMFYFYNVYSGGYIAQFNSSTSNGTTITLGTAASVTGNLIPADFNTNYGNLTYLPDSQTMYVVFGNQQTSYYLSYITITASTAGVITQGTVTAVNTSNNANAGGDWNTVWDSTNKKFVRPFNIGATSFPAAIAFNPAFSSANSQNFIGLSTASYTNGQTASIGVVGYLSTSVSGLTAGKKYYVQDNGTLGLVPTSSNVYAGIATSATKLLVKG